MYKFTCLSILLLICVYSFASDSLRTETVNGKKVIVHKVDQGQTLFAIARRYKVSVNEIRAINPAADQLKTGSEIFVPARQPDPEQNKPEPARIVKGTDEEHEDIIHKVVPGETLYRISKIYNVPVSEIIAANELGNKGIKTGQELIIPNQEKQSSVTKTDYQEKQVSKTEMTKTPSGPVTVKSEKKTSHTGYPAVTESGGARLDETMSNEQYQVLHASAKPGTLIMIRNKENGLTAHALVTGKATGPELAVMNKKVYEKLECKTSPVTVEIYYTPED